jgi:hypothetical protein
MRFKLSLAALAAIAALSSSLAAQDAVYHPSNRNPNGREVVAVVISSTSCVANDDPTFRPALREMMRRLGVQRDSLGISVAIVGVIADWSTRDGIAYLQDIGDFDEISVGRNWFNNTVVQRVWMSEGASPSVPQVILLEHTVNDGSDGSNRVSVTGERVLRRIVGGDAIQAWAAAGAPIGR